VGFSLIERLPALDTSAVSDAMDQLQLPSGVVNGIASVSVARRIAGRVLTVTLDEARGRRPEHHLGTAAIDAAEPGDVIVVSHRGVRDVSGWGGLLSLGASMRGIRGVIVDGACRDADEMVDLDFPVYARGTTPRTARGRVIQTAWNAAIVIDGISVKPGDFVIADRTGLVFLPQARAAEIVSAAEAIYAREQAMAQAIRGGATLVEALTSYESLLANAGPRG
jgi:regulator of RNase E activity RraA